MIDKTMEKILPERLIIINLTWRSSVLMSLLKCLKSMNTGLSLPSISLDQQMNTCVGSSNAFSQIQCLTCWSQKNRTSWSGLLYCMIFTRKVTHCLRAKTTYTHSWVQLIALLSLRNWKSSIYKIWINNSYLMRSSSLSSIASKNTKMALMVGANSFTRIIICRKFLFFSGSRHLPSALVAVALSLI